MLRAFPTIHVVVAAAALAMGFGAAQAQQRTVYRCVNAAGAVVFSDTECPTGKTARVNLKSASEEDLARAKAEHDAKTFRDANLANRVQADRIASEQAARAAQDQQAQQNRAANLQFEQERNQRNAAVNSAPNVAQPVPFTGP
jgi:Skp family chaperone for outer membrane proteins